MIRSPSSDGNHGGSGAAELRNSSADTPNLNLIFKEAFLVDPETSFPCVECGITYTMTEKEHLRFKDLAAQNPAFRMPKRCAECRRLRRLEQERTLPRPAIARPLTPMVQRVNAPVMAPTVLPKPSVSETVDLDLGSGVTEDFMVEAPKKEVVFMLATKDFEELVHGRPVVWQGVRVILAQIGFENMHKAIDRAELEKAKEHVKANGH